MALSCIRECTESLLFLFLKSMLQAQKHIRLEEIAGLEKQVEEEPEGEEIVGSDGEALKPPTTGIPFFL